jgi:hypothetical protein
MTAVANPTWTLKIRRVRRRILVLVQEKAESSADVAAIDLAIAGLEADIAALQRAQIAAHTAAEIPDMSRSVYARAFGIKGEH